MQHDPEAERHLDAHLDPDEHPVWTGRPDPKRLFWPGDLISVPIGVVMLVVVSSAYFGILLGAPDSPGVDRGPNAGSIVGSTIFLLLGGGFAYLLTFGRFHLRRVMKRRTYHGLTEHRAVVVYDGRWIHRVREALLSETELDTRRRRDGSGTITFKPVHGARTSNGSADPFLAMVVQNGPVAFWDLLDVDLVARKVRELRSGRRT